MSTTQADIRIWLNEGKRRGATHLIVVCDTFDHDGHPHYVMPGSDPKEYKPGEMQRIMECYALHLDWEKQLAEFRAFHYEMQKKRPIAVAKKPRISLPKSQMAEYRAVCGALRIARKRVQSLLKDFTKVSGWEYADALAHALEQRDRLHGRRAQLLLRGRARARS